jgi:DNA-binding CsgD family transcriptional regulator
MNVSDVFVLPEPQLSLRQELLMQLSPAERLVVLQVCEGLSNKEIASSLGKTESTIKAQLWSACGKLRVPTRTRLMALLLAGAGGR